MNELVGYNADIAQLRTNSDGWVNDEDYLGDNEEIVSIGELEASPNADTNEVGAPKIVPNNERLESLHSSILVISVVFSRML